MERKTKRISEPGRDQPTLLRRLGLMDSTFLVIGAVLGSGIFMTTGLVAARLPSPLLILGVFLVGGFITLSGALTFGELGAMFPRAGGQYLYLREAYGPASGFLYGWVFFLIIQCGGVAALAVAFADYVGPFISPAFARPLFRLDLGIMTWGLTPGQLLAVGAILTLSASHYYGLRLGVTIQNIFTVIRLLGVGLFAAAGFLALARQPGGPAWERISWGEGSFGLTGFGLALVTVLWAYDGWYAVSCTAEEVKRPERNLPLSLLVGTLTVTLVYWILNFIYFLSMPVTEMAGLERIGEAAAGQLFGPGGAGIMAGVIAATIFGCLSANLVFGPRVSLAMARDKLFFSGFNTIHPRHRVPSKAIIGQALWSSLLCLSGQFQALIEYVVFALVLFFAATGLAVFVLRAKKPGLKRPYRVWGYPVLPGLFVAINLAVFVNRLVAETGRSLIGIVIILLGLPAYFYWKDKSKPRPSSSDAP